MCQHHYWCFRANRIRSENHIDCDFGIRKPCLACSVIDCFGLFATRDGGPNNSSLCDLCISCRTCASGTGTSFTDYPSFHFLVCIAFDHHPACLWNGFHRCGDGGRNELVESRRLCDVTRGRALFGSDRDGGASRYHPSP